MSTVDYVSYGDLIRAVETTLGRAREILKTESMERLSEGYSDMPLLQVYPDASDTDSRGETTDRSTFRAGVRQTGLVINADCVVKQRSNLGEDMLRTVSLADAVQMELEKQDTKPYFQNRAIKAFHWSWQRVTFKYGDPETSYVGIRFTINLTIF